MSEGRFPVYRRRDGGCSVEKSGVQLDNRFVIPHDPYMLCRYRSYINVELSNQSRSIKYLFKYLHKGYDRVTVAAYQNNQNA